MGKAKGDSSPGWDTLRFGKAVPAVKGKASPCSCTLRHLGHSSPGRGILRPPGQGCFGREGQGCSRLNGKDAPCCPALTLRFGKAQTGRHLKAIEPKNKKGYRAEKGYRARVSVALHFPRGGVTVIELFRPHLRAALA